MHMYSSFQLEMRTHRVPKKSALSSAFVWYLAKIRWGAEASTDVGVGRILHAMTYGFQRHRSQPVGHCFFKSLFHSSRTCSILSQRIATHNIFWPLCKLDASGLTKLSGGEDRISSRLFFSGPSRCSKHIKGHCKIRRIATGLAWKMLTF
jgi:hypothetical protein